MSLLRVTYVSRHAGGNDLLDDLRAILAVSRARNPLVGVTGALLVGADGFAQVLEGAPAAVTEVFERIQCDERHDAVLVLGSEPIAARDFAEWSMAGCDGREALSAAGLSLAALPQAGTGTVMDLLQRAMRTQAELGALLAQPPGRRDLHA